MGLVAEWVQFGWRDPSHWIPDIVVGWCLIACGLVASSRRPESRSGVLLTAAGFAWFVGNLSAAGWDPLASVGGQLAFLYLGLLLHCVVGYPSGRLESLLGRASVSAGYAAAVSLPQAPTPLTIVIACLLIGTTFYGYLEARGLDRRLRVPAVQAAFVLGITLLVGAATHVAFPAGDADHEVLLAYQAALCTNALVLLGGLLRRPAEERQVADLVVDLGATQPASLRDALARTLGDPALEIGYWSPEAGAYVSAAGDRLALPGPASHQRATTVDRDGQRIAVLVHDPAVLDDPALAGGLEAAARLAAVNARLQAQVRAQLDELGASRRRLVEAGDATRQRLEAQLRDGAERHLVGLSQTLAQAVSESNERLAPETLEAIARAEAQVTHTLEELRELARGLHPRVLADEGLGAALGSLAEQSPLPVDLSVTVDNLGEEVEAAIYFVCAETLANAAKHASASRARIIVGARDGRVRVEIADDGIGSADLSRGTGLLGLVDRVEALGGSLRIASPHGGGTRINAEVPAKSADLPPRSAPEEDPGLRAAAAAVHCVEEAELTTLERPLSAEHESNQ